MRRWAWVLLGVGLARAECGYPCWTEIPAGKFTYESFTAEPKPAVEAPFEFAMPYPAQGGGNDAGCTAEENAKVEIYSYDARTGTWAGPATGPVWRYPSYVEVSGKGEGRKGIAVRTAYFGKAAGARGASVVESVFFHDDRCYHASAEFGFSHSVKGAATDATVQFYYEINANCNPKGKCRARGTGEILIDQRDNVPVAIPEGVNSRGGRDWVYEAYLIEGGARWRVRVVDPYTFEEKAKAVDWEVKDFFAAAAREYWERGAEGYVTATSLRIGEMVTEGAGPWMGVAKVAVAK